MRSVCQPVSATGWRSTRSVSSIVRRTARSSAPIVLRTAFPHIDLPWPPVDDAPMLMVEIDGQSIPYTDQLVYPALATLCGQPATAFPVGLSRAGLPLGLQAIGPYLEDRTPIRFAALASQTMGGFVRPPGYDA